MIADSSMFCKKKGTKVKQSTEEQDASCRPPASSSAGPEAQGAASMPMEVRELHTRNSHQQNMASETVSFHVPIYPIFNFSMHCSTCISRVGKLGGHSSLHGPCLRT